MHPSHTSPWLRPASRISAHMIIAFARLLTGVRAVWAGSPPKAEQTLYFANHSSHGDFVLLWATLPPDLRAVTRPVAGEEYWNASGLRRFIGHAVFRALMIHREANARAADPFQQMAQALQAGDSLIMFPEGTRNTSEAVLLPFKSGLYHLAGQCPHVRFVPVWIDNLKRVLPKGVLLPIPLACSVHYGAPIALEAGESKTEFLERTRQALLDLRPDTEPTQD